MEEDKDCTKNFAFFAYFEMVENTFFKQGSLDLKLYHRRCKEITKIQRLFLIILLHCIKGLKREEDILDG